jgi:hypothetical protein
MYVVPSARLQEFIKGPVITGFNHAKVTFYVTLVGILLKKGVGWSLVDECKRNEQAQ